MDVESLGMIYIYKVMITKLSRCINLESKIIEEIGACLMRLPKYIMTLTGDEIQSVLLDAYH